MKLRAIDGALAGREWALAGTFTIGRTRENDLHLPDDTASRRHTRLTRRGAEVFVEDLGSANGTLVNGARIEGAVRLAPGDEVLIGHTRFAVVPDDAAAGRAGSHVSRRTRDARTGDRAAFDARFGTPSRGPAAPDPAADAEPARRPTVLMEAEGEDERWTRLIRARRSAAGAGPETLAAAGTAPADLREHLRRVLCVDDSVRDERDLEALAARVLPAWHAAMPFERGFLELTDEQGETLPACHHQPHGGAPFTPPRGIPRYVRKHREAVLVEAVTEDRRFRRRKSLVAGGVQSAICVPLLAGPAGGASDAPAGPLLGVFYADRVFHERPFDERDLAFCCWAAERCAHAFQAALALRAQGRELAALKAGAGAVPPLLGASAPMAALGALIARLADSDAPVLISGETGTGKELVARHLHAGGRRRAGPFVALNCAALPAGLLESECFGHEQGAFTGATAAVPGTFERAAGGTLFLDEIGLLPIALQAKLLRVLESGEYYRVGGTVLRHSDARVIAATNQDLDRAVRAREFREDLLYRLRVLHVETPPLRARPGDVPLLAAHFLAPLARRRGTPARATGSGPALTLAPAAQAALERYAWPGNVRQLQHALERAAILTDDATIGCAQLPPEVTGARPDELRRTLEERPLSLAEAEALTIRAALRHTGGKKGEAAALLGISWPTLNKKIEAYGLAGEAGGPAASRLCP